MKPSRRPRPGARAVERSASAGRAKFDQSGFGTDPAPACGALPAGRRLGGFPSPRHLLPGCSLDRRWFWLAPCTTPTGEQIHHRDVKPANILLTINHGPQLLDFNLAESPHSADHAQAALRGGTLPYMAPEQIEAFLNPELWASVGAGADIYSLGLVLARALDRPDARSAHEGRCRQPGRCATCSIAGRISTSRFADSIRRFRRRSKRSWRNAWLLEPGDRYADAESLAKDLERFLEPSAAPQGRQSVASRASGELLDATAPETRARRPRQRACARRRGLGRAAHVRLAHAVVPLEFRSFKPPSTTLKDGSDGSRQGCLNAIVKCSPHACLAKIYLAFVHDADRTSRMRRRQEHA